MPPGPFSTGVDASLAPMRKTIAAHDDKRSNTVYKIATGNKIKNFPHPTAGNRRFTKYQREREQPADFTIRGERDGYSGVWVSKRENPAGSNE